jgi:histidinol-phosphate aminotransferase
MNQRITVDLSRNESPFDMHPRVRRAVSEALAEVNRYPEFDAATLRRALAEKSGVLPSQVVVGPGSVRVLDDLVVLVSARGGSALLLEPDFEAFRQQVGRTGMRIRSVATTGPNQPEPQGWADTEIPADTTLMMFSNPHNPVGTSVTCAQLTGLLGRVPREAVVVVDEAYRDFASPTTCRDATEHADEHPGLVVVRTFSKAFGLAGLRIGYALLPEKLAVALHRPYPVSTVATAAALEALDVEREIAVESLALIGYREALRQEVTALGLPVEASEGNFLWLAVGGLACGLATHLAERGVAVREVKGQGIRVSVGLPHQNRTFVAGVREFLGQCGIRATPRSSPPCPSGP